MDQPGNHILLRGNQAGAADRMRELLARTVQDHVADQRSNAGALEDIRQRMEGLEWLVKEVREREMAGLGPRPPPRGRWGGRPGGGGGAGGAGGGGRRGGGAGPAPPPRRAGRPPRPD